MECANPDCPHHGSVMHMQRVVQITETQRTPGGVFTTFAAVTCSKRCAAAVLLTQADDEGALTSAPLFFPEPEEVL